MASADGEKLSEKLDPQAVARLYVQHSDEMRRFLVGLLRSHALADEALQATFVKAIESGHQAQAETQKGWLFRVAYHEAMAVRRRQGVHKRAADQLSRMNGRAVEEPDKNLARAETVSTVRAALDRLPPDQQQVVRLRIFEDKKFKDIAHELGVPLGTVLTRMHAALAKLRQRLQGEQ